MDAFTFVLYVYNLFSHAWTPTGREVGDRDGAMCGDGETVKGTSRTLANRWGRQQCELDTHPRRAWTSLKSQQLCWALPKCCFFLLIKKSEGEGTRRWIIDISIVQWQPTTPKKEDEKTPKAPTGSHNQQEAKPSPNPQIEKKTNHKKNDLQFNTPDSLPLKSPCSSRLHYTLPSNTGSATFTLKCQGNQHLCKQVP
jgi:hypothetical protein